jgi:AcrR family transcriptional regulator
MLARSKHTETDVAGSRRVELVRAAYEQLAEHGFEGLRTRVIAGAVGVNIATLHYYFPHKQDLVRSVVGYAMARFRSTLAGEGTAADRLRAHFDGLRRLSRAEPELFRVMAELALRASRDPAIATILRKTDDAWHETLRDLLRDAREEGGLSASLDPEAVAALIVAVLKGAYVLPAASRQSERLDQAVRQLEASIGIAKGRRVR